TDHLKRFLELRRTSIEALPPDVHGAHLALIETLGLRTAEMHLALAERTGHAAFEPVALSAEDVAVDVRRTMESAREVLQELATQAGQLPAAAAEEVQAVLDARARIDERIRELGDEVPAGQGLRIRTHGDYHLAQVLLAKNDFVITDFEGEPGRSFEERRLKRSPLRDVAGMLRSFGYAALDALGDVATSTDEWVALGPLAAEWELQSRNAFLRGYDARAHGTGLYGALEPGRGLLGLFELEKALYELRYELKNRPDWVRIPLQGILGVVGRS
ncbi:MAG TPA: alpha-amylase, partial [Burkholderiaceae bacterium]|nr:alpha-amylase [Burkholderiaceae bacterium]